jgi:phenylacetate-CoA ligase
MSDLDFNHDVSDYDAIRARQMADALAQLPQYLDRLTWSPAQLASYRSQRLRQLLRLARDRSAWHGRRLAHFDPDRLDDGQLARALAEIPPMTKDDLMSHFDDIVTDHRFTLARIEDHLAGLRSDAYLPGGHHAFASGGSSGRRGVYLYDWNGWIGWYLTTMRQAFALQGRVPRPPGEVLRGAVVTGDRATHVSSAAAQTFRDSGAVAWTRFPVTAPLSEQLAGLSALAPAVLVAYPSLLHRLTHAQQAGALAIAPRLVVASGEPLLPEIRAGITQAWGCAIINSWASSEAGGMGASCGHGAGLHLSDDVLLIEPVDRAGRPVGPGERSTKLFVTNLFNQALPLIRFEISDEVILSRDPCPCGSGHRLAADVEGRLDDSFAYPGVAPIHPQALRARLGRERHLVEYQVVQRRRGIEVVLHRQGTIDFGQLSADLSALLRTAGLADPEVVLRDGDRDQQPGSPAARTVTGKLRRFVPLHQPGVNEQ